MQDAEMQREPMGVDTLHPEFVPVVFADDRETAEMYQAMLDRNNIAALVDDHRGSDEMYTALARGIPVLVPEEMHDRATEIVAADEHAARVLDVLDDDEEDEDIYDDDEEEEEEFDDDEEEEDEEFDDEDFDDEEEEEEEDEDEDDFEDDEFEDEDEEEEDEDDEDLDEDEEEEDDEDDDDFDDEDEDY